MNLLTGQAKQDFEKWLTENNHTPWTVFFDSLPDTVKNAYYVEFFDLQGIHIRTWCVIVPHEENKIKWNYDIFNYEDFSENTFTRIESTIQSIISANNLYNEIYTNNNG